MDERSSSTEENKGTLILEIPIMPALTMIDAVATAKKVPPLIASKKVHSELVPPSARLGCNIDLELTYRQSIISINGIKSKKN